MRLTKRQRDEVEYLQHFARFTASDEDVKDYIEATVHGKTTLGDKLSSNKLRHAKARLNMTIAMWVEDLSTGLLSFDELLEDPQLQSPYIQRIIETLRPSYLGESATFFREVLKDNIYHIMSKQLQLCPSN